MTTAEQLAIPSAMVALVFLVFAWIKYRAERSALPECGVSGSRDCRWPQLRRVFL
jgi:hypothetical protein